MMSNKTGIIQSFKVLVAGTSFKFLNESTIIKENKNKPKNKNTGAAGLK